MNDLKRNKGVAIHKTTMQNIDIRHFYYLMNVNIYFVCFNRYKESIRIM